MKAFRAIADEFVAKMEKEGRAPATLTKIRWLLDFAHAAFGDRPIRDLKAPEVLAVLRQVEARGRHVSARNLRASLGSVFRYAIATARADNDPTSALKGALIRPVVRPRAAVTDPEAFGALLRAVWGYSGSPEVLAALKLLALVAVRPGELRAAEWPEFDLEAAVWTVPGERTKMRRPHRVPLSAQSLAVLRDVHRSPGAANSFFRVAAPRLVPSVRTL